MSTAYFYRQMVLKSVHGGGILSIESRNGEVKLAVDAKYQGEAGKLRLVILGEGGMDIFPIKGLCDTLSFTVDRLCLKVNKYCAAGIADEKGSFIMKGQYSGFDWSCAELWRIEDLTAKEGTPKAVMQADEQKAEVKKAPMHADEKKTEVKKAPMHADEQKAPVKKAPIHVEKDKISPGEKDVIAFKTGNLVMETANFTGERGPRIDRPAVVEEWLHNKKKEEVREQKLELKMDREEKRASLRADIPKESKAEKCTPSKDEEIESNIKAFVKKWPGSYWNCMYYPGSSEMYYLEGIIPKGRRPVACYAVPGGPQDRHTKGVSYFEVNAKGWWLMFRPPVLQ